MQHYILCIETSGKRCSVALSSNDTCLDGKSSTDEWSQSEKITILIGELLKTNNLSTSDISAVALSKGPGSYTGLRVGASAAKAICFVHKIPLLAIDTLKILAYPHIKDTSRDQRIIPMIDARRSEVYYNIYDSQLKADIETTNLILEPDHFKELSSPIICGDGAEKANNLINHSTAIFKPAHAKAMDMTSLAYYAFKAENFENLAYFNPFYLKPPNITKSKKQLF